MASDRLVPLHVAGLPVNVFAAMLEGISRRYPDAKWVIHHDFGDGPFVLDLGERYVDPYGEEWDEDETAMPRMTGDSPAG